LAADWDLGSNTANDTADYDPTLRLAYAYGDEASNTYVGMALLRSPNNTTVFATADTTSAFGYSDSAKYLALRGQWAGVSLMDADVMQTLSAGPFVLLGGQSATFVYAVLAGDGLSGLEKSLGDAEQAYKCLFEDTPLPLSLGSSSQIAVCDSMLLDATTPGAVAYQWNTGATTPTLGVRQTGTYRVTAFSASGCRVSESVEVQVTPSLVPDFTVEPRVVGLDEGATVRFTDNTQGVQSRMWLFGNGFGFIGSSTSHTYQAVGTYPVQLMLSNGACKDTLLVEVRVVQTTNRSQLAEVGQLQLYPNPAYAGWLMVGLPAEVPQAVGRIKNLLGQPVSRDFQLQAGDTQLEFQDLPAGVYVLEVVHSGGKISTRFVR
jgi:hypothetical protein